MPVISTADRVIVSVSATGGGNWQVVDVPTGFQGITSSNFEDDQYLSAVLLHENGVDWEVYDADDDSTDHLLQISNVTGTVTLTRPATPYSSSNSGSRINASTGTHTLFISVSAGSMKRLMRESNPTWKALTSGDATPSVADYRFFTTAGTTTITRFDDMEDGKLFLVRRGASDITIQHGSDIVVSGGADLSLTSTSPVAMFVENGGVARQVGGGGSGFAGNTTTTLAALAAVGNAINTSGKFKGRLVEDETDRTWKALGALATSKWRPLDDQSGVSDITPA